MTYFFKSLLAQFFLLLMMNFPTSKASFFVVRAKCKAITDQTVLSLPHGQVIFCGSSAHCPEVTQRHWLCCQPLVPKSHIYSDPDHTDQCHGRDWCNDSSSTLIISTYRGFLVYLASHAVMDKDWEHITSIWNRTSMVIIFKSYNYQCICIADHLFTTAICDRYLSQILCAL